VVADVDNGEFAMIKDVGIRRQDVLLCLEHKIQLEITNSSPTKIESTLHRLLTGTYVRGELTMVEDADIPGRLVLLCLQHEIHRQTTNLSQTANYLIHTIYLLVLTLFNADGC